MQLKDRLARLQTQTGSGLHGHATNPAGADLRARLAQIKPERLHHQPSRPSVGLSDEALARQLQGQLVAEGVIKLQQQLPLTGKLGRFDLAHCQQTPRLPGESHTEQHRLVYFDTETTGLSGGSGTVIFLLGVASVSQESVLLEQWLLTRFAGEAALLSIFAQALSPMDKLVSYNGKSYDLPLLISRFRMQGLAHSFERLAHLDLLHPVRRLFGKQWSDCRLTTLENELLGFQRIDDLPGAQAPAAWFDYVRHGVAERLIRVVAHHRQDILSLVAALAALAQVIERPHAFGADLSSVAKWLADTDENRALALLLSQRNRLCNESKRLLGLLAKRAGDWALATRLWEELAAAGCTDSLERLAMYHENIRKDFALAKHYCEALPESDTRSHRLARLNRRLHDRVAQTALCYASIDDRDID